MDIAAEIRNLLDGPKFPDREFVSSGATFGEVYGLAEALHADLTREPYSRQPVCLATNDRALLAAALLASLAGGPTLLLPYAYSAAALDRMQALTGFAAAINEPGIPLPEGTEIIRPRQGDTALKLSAGRNTPQSEFLKIFTGGTTGAPQIWSKTGENIFGEGFFLARHFGITEQDRIVATVPPYHIYGLLFSVILPLVSSSTVAAATPSFPAEIAEAIHEKRATILVSIPPHYRVLRDKKMTAASLRLAFSSAGMLDAGDNEAFCRTNGVGITEVYGSTETGGIAKRNRFMGETCFTPFPVVDWKMKEERICVQSPFLSPDLPRENDGFFIAGDRVEPCGANGFALLGRADGVTKVGGKRVDLEEIRGTIRNEPGIVDCVVMALPDPGGRGSRILVLIQGETADIDGIRDHLRQRFEPSAQPRSIKKVGRIPVLENGKYDREAIIHLFET